mgnify:CR=1 FL=1
MSKDLKTSLHVRPASSERNTPPESCSTMSHTRRGLAALTARPALPMGPDWGSPFARVNSVHVAPPSVVFHRALPGPPLCRKYGPRTRDGHPVRSYGVLLDGRAVPPEIDLSYTPSGRARVSSRAGALTGILGALLILTAIAQLTGWSSRWHPRGPVVAGAVAAVALATAGVAVGAAVLDGRIQPDAIRLYATALHPSEMFWRQLKFGDLDVSEMSMSSLAIATAVSPRMETERMKGGWPWLVNAYAPSA